MKIATLDLGTNTFLCLIAECEKNSPPRIIADLSQIVRLGQGVQENKCFHPEALSRAEKCLIEFKKEMTKAGVEKIIAGTTSAARDVKNLGDLLNIGQRLGIKIDLISGKEEAELTYRGAFFGLEDFKINQDNRQKAIVIDIGGGSTEIIYGDGINIEFSTSLQMGGVRFTDLFVPHQPVSIAERENLLTGIRTQLLVLENLKNVQIDHVVAVAGTPTALAALELGQYVAEQVNGFRISLKSLQDWNKKLEKSSIEEKKEKYGLGGRADIIYAGTSILLEILRYLNQSGVIVSTGGVRYGMLLKLCKEEGLFF
jgi:exopolyphosphatase/guanosine-5'-triphosphate,3'-diphosphate pyrophosphatase